MDDQVKTNKDKNEEADNTVTSEDKLTEEQIKEDTQMVSIDEDLTAQEEINETPTSLTDTQIKEDKEMAEVSEDLKEQPE